LDVDKLVVKLAEVGRGIVMRRFHARGRGRSARVEKWFSHLKIVVAEREAVERPMRDTRPGHQKSAPKPAAQTVGEPA
jgi:large subunit ribosomal protein L22